MSYSFKIEYFENDFTNKIKGMFFFNDNNQISEKIVFEYDYKGRIIKEIRLDSKNEEIGKWEHKYDDEKKICYSEYTDIYKNKETQKRTIKELEMDTIKELIDNLEKEPFNIIQSRLESKNKKIVMKKNQEEVYSITKIESGFEIFSVSGKFGISNLDCLEEYVSIVDI